MGKAESERATDTETARAPFCSVKKLDDLSRQPPFSSRSATPLLSPILVSTLVARFADASCPTRRDGCEERRGENGADGAWALG